MSAAESVCQVCEGAGDAPARPRRLGFPALSRAHQEARAQRLAPKGREVGEYARGVAIALELADEHLVAGLDELGADGWQGVAMGLETLAAELRRRARDVGAAQ